MKKFAPMIILFVSLLLVGCTSVVDSSEVEGEKAQDEQSNQSLNSTQEPDKTEKEKVVSLVEKFGERLQQVTLLAPPEQVKGSIQEIYGPLVSEALLSKWLKKPEDAPGRMVSSPWPDRIEINTVEMSTEDTYKIDGEIIEVTSVELENGGSAAKRAVSLTVRKIDGKWLIDSVSVGAYING